MVESAICHFSKFSETLPVYFGPKLFMQLCIMQFRMQSPIWLNITVRSTVYQARVIILLNTSTVDLEIFVVQDIHENFLTVLNRIYVPTFSDPERDCIC